MAAFRDIIITGLLLGGIFALVSVGLSLQYGVARVLNVAHGEFIMIGAFVTFWLFGSVNLNPLVSLVVSAPLMFAIGWFLHVTLFRRLMDTAPNLNVFEGTSMLASFGLLYIVQNIARIIWGSQTHQVLFLNRTVTSAQIPLNRLVALGVCVVVGVAFYLFLARTRLGKAIRSSAQDPTTAGLMGVNIHSVLAICFGLGLGMAGIAGSLLSYGLCDSDEHGASVHGHRHDRGGAGGHRQHHRGHDRRRHPGDRVANRHVFPADHDLYRLLHHLYLGAVDKAQRDHG